MTTPDPQDIPPLLWRDPTATAARLADLRADFSAGSLAFRWGEERDMWEGPLLTVAPVTNERTYAWLCRVERPGPLTPHQKRTIETLAVLRYNLQEML